MISTQLKRASKQRNLQEAFKNDDGAIDLASIMVGIIVIGIIGGVIAATVFAIIPWSQDNGAKQQLDSVASAESAYRGLATDQGNDSFGDANELNNQGANNYGKLFDANAAGVTITTSGTGSAATYTATITSKSGKTFSITDGGKPVEVTTPTASAKTGYLGSGGYSYLGGSNSDGTYAPSDVQESDLDQSYSGELTLSNNSTDVNTGGYTQLKAIEQSNVKVYSDSDADPDNGTNLPFPADKQWQEVTYNTSMDIRPDSVQLFNGTTPIGDAYTPAKGSFIHVTDADSDPNGFPGGWYLQFLIPTNIDHNAVNAASNNNTLVVKAVMNGVPMTFSQDNN